MLADRQPLRRRLDRLCRDHAAGRLNQQAYAGLSAAIDASKERRARRLAALPIPEFPEDLPVSEQREKIAAVIREHQVVIVCGETGSGKTTQLPKICLSLGRGAAGYIGHTQPRRIAARSVAMRIASELHSEIGGLVGYKVRFQDKTSDAACIKLMTDGILLAETQGDPDLTQYDTIIIDEAHERSLNIDFLLGYLKQLLPKRPDLKLIITSATIDPERFARHFTDAPIITVSGRSYPVEMRYRPLLAENEDQQDRDVQRAILDAVDELSQLGPGDILIFLSGEREIRETAENLRKHHPPHTEILPLYARLNAAEQEQVFRPHTGRRIVLATNVAETSLTVPGIRYVIDPGHARVSRYNPRTKVQRLPIETISQAAADQRAGRCGRVSSGVCIRLYSEQDYELRPRYTDPEIRRANLAQVILQMKALKLREIEHFPFMDPPDSRHIKDGYQTLIELGALDEQRHLTELGRHLAKLPADPRIGRMILAARDEHCLSEALIIAAALSIADPRERPLESQQQADACHRAFSDERSDFLSYLRLWDAYEEQARHLSQAKLRRWCAERYLSYVRMREWRDIHTQLYTVAKEIGLRLNDIPADYAALHRALLAGLLGNIAIKGDDREYLGARNTKLTIFPGSSLHKKPPKWIMAAELVETTRLYARTVARIESEWLERVGAHLLRRSHFEPHWEKGRAQVVAYERVVLFGLTVVEKRRIVFGPIDPVTAREIFIRAALVGGEYRTNAPFFTHNRDLLTEVEELEHKQRRRDLVIDEHQLYAFYDARIPAGIYNGPLFERWRKEQERTNPRLLFMTREDLMNEGAVAASAEQFPAHLELQGLRMQLEYRFEPGHEEDGVTVIVPVPVLNQLQPARFDWLVPGLLREKVAALLKSLPQGLRRHFVPVPNYADICLQTLTPGMQPLIQSITAILGKITGIDIPAEAWRADALPAHLRMNFKVVDAQGKAIAIGRDLAALQQGHRAQAQAAFAELPRNAYGRSGITVWDFGELPDQVEFQRDGLTLIGYPALAEEGDAVALRLFDTREAAHHAMQRGLLRLYIAQLPQQIKYLEKNLPSLQAMCLHYVPLGRCEELKQDMVAAAVTRAFLDTAQPRNQQAFEQRKEQGKARLPSLANELCACIQATLAEYTEIQKGLKSPLPPACQAALIDIKDQLQRLIYSGFVTRTSWTRLQHLPRYLKAIRLRLEKLPRNPARDQQLQGELAPLWQTYWQHASAATLEEFRWLLEELRVSLFAQELKTTAPVSVKRLQKMWQELQSQKA
ncbi:MAG: ATP-dependent RNA helicase HrpA [Gammaproteobacteria bacterium]|nr:ATP-dependent RNA helicase HrpA [Gammaproteobacteria bacterium]